MNAYLESAFPNHAVKKMHVWFAQLLCIYFNVEFVTYFWDSAYVICMYITNMFIYLSSRGYLRKYICRGYNLHKLKIKLTIKLTDY